MSKAFEGKVVIVTGANSGIGEAAALAFREAGARVYGFARRKDAVVSAREQHPQVHWMLADVANEAQATEAVQAVVSEAGRLDILVNNAGIGTFAPLEQSTGALIRPQFEVNVLGTTFVTRAAVSALKASKGSVVNIGSSAGHKPSPGSAHYGATKAAIESLTRSWALELAPSGVRVNALAPGGTQTPGLAKLGVPAEAMPQLQAAIMKQLPLGRMGTPEEVARWILQLADPSVTWLTGQVLGIDGGMSLT